jgi:uncharacterized PurR-regulated membrane protein YhhQ (DUF165 family)
MRDLNIFSIFGMTVLVLASNILVEYPINKWMTWGSLTYPFTFLITELVNRIYGPKRAKRVVYVGFVSAIVFSFWTVNWRISFASVWAFLISQLLDIFLFDRLRRKTWWVAPLVASSFATFTDTAIFFSLAFAGTNFPWITTGDSQQSLFEKNETENILCDAHLDLYPP